ncbi:hypothetical protein MLD38_022501 [Melastoma candidum]|uniref:Uncharacterized protein n=1 Tax=Melastoma candidum TaxID=119954 RepID=A0ACB9QSL0_9MYRT|nr:hypothetical protein MLD38_022501 [Melastoma candidum]
MGEAEDSGMVRQNYVAWERSEAAILSPRFELFLPLPCCSSAPNEIRLAFSVFVESGGRGKDSQEIKGEEDGGEMKRARDDLYPGGSQFKRPFGSSRGGGGDDYGQSPNHGLTAAEGRVEGYGGGSTSQKLTTNDALSYLKEVKDMFRDQREKYDKFLEVMKNFKAQRMDTSGVITKVKELFKGHNNLILGFNTFLPKGYEITLDEDEAPAKKTVEFEEAISFVNKIKKRFRSDEHVYKTFLDILNKYRKEHKDINEVSNEVGGLFADHPDLLEEFSRFLPDNSATHSAHAYGFGRNAVHRLNDRNLAAPNLRQMQIDKQSAQRDRIIGQSDPDRLDIEDDKASVKVHKKHFEREDMDRKNFDVDDRESEQGAGHFSDKRKSARKVEHSRTNSNFNANGEKDGLKHVYSQGFLFCEKVKERLCSSDDYQTFLKCLHIYSNGIIKRKDLQSLVTDLLGKHEDLVGDFNEFLERCENIDGFLAGVINRKSLSIDGHVSRTVPVDIKAEELRHDIEGAKERERCREKYWAKSIQELDLTDCQRCTPSYRLLPNDYPIPSVSQRTELGAQVLNEHWVSVTSGSEDYSFKHMRRNQFEESLFRCEDDRFELDMLLESVSSTMKRVEEVLSSMNDNIKSLETPIQVENYFSALNLRCIERLYGDHGLDVMDIIRKNPVVSLPVILSRLRQKQEEWTKCRSDFNRIWAEIYTKNHYRSLDHRSFYFKQQDSKNLSMKSLVTEIKDLKEKRQTEDIILLSFATGNGQAIVPQLECKYSDVDTLEDLYRLVRYSCEEVCSSKEQFNKVMRLWTNFLEPLVGVPTRPSLTDSAEVCKKSKNTVINCPSHGRLDNNEMDAEVVKTVPDIGDTMIPNGDTLLKVESNSHLLEIKPKSARYDSLPTVMDKSFERTDMEIIPVESSSNNANVIDHDSKTNTNEEGNDAEKACNSDIPLDSSNTSRHLEESMPLSKLEKEEGELSPSGDMEDDRNTLPDALDGVDGPQIYQSVAKVCVTVKEGGGNDADADDEESGNISETGGDGSGSDSGADEGSREEAEDEEENDLHEGEGKSESDGEEDDRESQSSRNFLSSAKPLSKYVPAATLPNTGERGSRLLYANDDLFLLFRLHQILYERILSAKTYSLGNDMKQRTSNEMKQRTSNDTCSLDPYSRFISALYNLLDGSLDNTKFEDECRDIIGNHAYVLFTLDKLIFKLVKQLQAVVSEDIDNKLLQLYEYEKSRKEGRTIDCVYYKNARFFLHNENIFRLEFMSNPTRMSVQFMDTMNEKPEVYSVSIDPNFTSYLHDDLLSISPGKRQLTDVYLKRNKPKHVDEEDDSLVCKALDSVHVVNGLECKIACSSSKISYVLDTEDLLFRRRRKSNVSLSAGAKSTSCDGQRVERFRQFLLDAVTPTKQVAQP